MESLLQINNKFERIIYKALYCRLFEEQVQKSIHNKSITIPCYLSIGQELIPATISEYFGNYSIFPQHRCHSTYLCFGGDPKNLVEELLGINNKGKLGSPSISSKKAKIFGHSGLMGDQVPIATGYALATNEPTIVFMGDASCEEDYVLGAIGYASTKNLPILFVVEDNNLSILTEKKVRRNWSIVNVALALGLVVGESNCNIGRIENIIKDIPLPALINVTYDRLVWHAGAGVDNNSFIDPLEINKECYPNLFNLAKQDINNLWQLQ